MNLTSKVPSGEVRPQNSKWGGIVLNKAGGYHLGLFLHGISGEYGRCVSSESGIRELLVSL